MLKITFVSNYINHHQIPFCDAMSELCDFTFVQTQPMEQERVQMGWHEEEVPPYVMRSYGSEDAHSKSMDLIMESDVVLFGGCEDESYIHPRLDAGRLTIRYSERVYRTGQWKCITPRGLRRKYLDHTKYRKGPVYLLCNGAYVASDFRIFHAYPGKMFRWGYFPETKRYDLDALMQGKGYRKDRELPQESDFSGKQEIAANQKLADNQKKIPYIIWVARLIPLKHPELALQTAKYLKDKDLAFHMDILGGGPMEDQLRTECTRMGLDDVVTFRGFQKPEDVRGYMEKANILLFTSDRREGWGAVINEGMNSGCAVVADSMIGGVPSLLLNGKNGCIYPDKVRSFLMKMTESLVRYPQECEQIGRAAYRTITERWNAQEAAARLLQLAHTLSEIWGVEEGKQGVPTVSKKEAAKAEKIIFANWMQEEDQLIPPGPCTRVFGRSEKQIQKALFP